MFEFFTPTTKVQKNRQVMHDTDARVAKYSRRGLVLNFIIFSLVLTFGDFFHRETKLSIILITGLVLVTLLRSYYLFRFEVLYARAPRRWRTQYFLASCLGAVWWSIILVSLTWMQGMQNETLIMWLYTVVFYSSIANVFAPYLRFLKIYLFIGQIPTAVVALLLGTVESYMYGAIMIMFYFMLIHQARVTSAAYWERVEAHHTLHEHAKGLEHEQRSSRAATELKDEFLINLGQEFRASLNDILGTLNIVENTKLSERQQELLDLAITAGEQQLDLVNNVVDFSKITTRSLVLDESVFDLRRLMAKLVKDFALKAHQKGIELNYLLDSELPLRVKGDSARIHQITATLLGHMLKFAVTENVFLDVTYNTNHEDVGELQIIIHDTHDYRALGEKNDADDSKLQEAEETGRIGIGLAISKGLAECMGGSVHLLKARSGGGRAVICVQVQAVSHQGRALGSDHKLRGKRILLVDVPDRVAQDLVDELDNWGVQADTVYGYEKAREKIIAAEQRSQAIDMLLIYNQLNTFNALALSKEIAAREESADVKQMIAMSVLQRDSDDVRQHLEHFSQVVCIEKPFMYRQLYDATCQHLLGKRYSVDEQASQAIKENALQKAPHKILVVEDQRVNQMVASGMLKKLGCYVHLSATGQDALAILEKEKFDLVLFDGELPDNSALLAVKNILEKEKISNSRKHIPLIAMTAELNEVEISHLIAEGFDDHIPKPLNYHNLNARLERWLDVTD